MKKNMGAVDRILRLLIAVVIGVLFYEGEISGVTGFVFALVSSVFVLTAIFGACPLYAFLRINTCGLRSRA